MIPESEDDEVTPTRAETREARKQAEKRPESWVMARVTKRTRIHLDAERKRKATR